MRTAIGVMGLVLATFCASAESEGAGYPSVAAVVASSGEGFDYNYADFDILLEAVTAAGLVDTLSDPQGSFTVFAPNDFAFVLLARDLGYRGFSEQGAWEFLAANVPLSLLTDVLLYHVAPEELTTLDLLFAGYTGQSVPTALGLSFRPSVFGLIDNDPNSPNASVFVPYNVHTGNGIVHTVSRVLRPIDL